MTSKETLGTYTECRDCPFVLPCLTGRLFGTHGSPKRFICPVCANVWQSEGEERHVCPVYTVSVVTRNAWYREALHLINEKKIGLNPIIWTVDPYYAHIGVYACRDCFTHIVTTL